MSVCEVSDSDSEASSIVAYEATRREKTNVLVSE